MYGTENQENNGGGVEIVKRDSMSTILEDSENEIPAKRVLRGNEK